MFEDLADAVIYEAVNGRFNLDLGSLQSLIRTGNKLGQDGGSISAITIGPLLTMELELRLRMLERLGMKRRRRKMAKM